MWILQAKRGLAVYDVWPRLVWIMDSEGKTRLRKVAKECQNHAQRVQNSVFECVVTEAQYSLLKGRVRDIIDMSLDSVRFYILSKNENKRVEVIGVETAYKLEEALII